LLRLNLSALIKVVGSLYRMPEHASILIAVATYIVLSVFVAIADLDREAVAWSEIIVLALVGGVSYLFQRVHNKKWHRYCLDAEERMIADYKTSSNRTR
jgi:beta-lactamase superfamily II metal-dependent hydrolase